MSSPAAHCSFDDTVIDFAGHRLLRGGVEQPLEPKAFAVLALLAGEPGRVFMRDEILDAVWGHRHVTPGVLNRVMTLLRQALGEDAHHPRLLQTVHGVGYRFDLPPASSDPAPPASGSFAGPLGNEPAPTAAEVPPAPTPAARRLQPALFLLLALVGIGTVGAWWWNRQTPGTTRHASAGIGDVAPAIHGADIGSDAAETHRQRRQRESDRRRAR